MSRSLPRSTARSRDQHRVLPSLSDRSSKRSRATAYRLIRHSLVDFHSVERLKEQKLDWFLVKSLSRDSKYAVEKEQVIKLIRAIVEIGSERRRPGAANACASGAVPLSSAVMRAVIAVAESTDDPFRPICLQTLTEICEPFLCHTRRHELMRIVQCSLTLS